MAFSKARTKRFNEVLSSCAPPPGHYNPKLENSNLPGAYIEKTERFKPLAKGSPPKSFLSVPSTSKNFFWHQGGLRDKEKSLKQPEFPKERRNLNAEISELHQKICNLEQDLFESKAELASLIEEREKLGLSDSLEDRSLIKQTKRCPDSDSEGTLSVDEEQEDICAQLISLKDELNRSRISCEEEQRKNLNLSELLKKQEQITPGRRRKRICTKPRSACPKKVVPDAENLPNIDLDKHMTITKPSNSDDVTGEKEPDHLLNKAQLDLQFECDNLDAGISCLKSFVEWLALLKPGKKSSDAFFMNNVVTLLSSFPDPPDKKNLIGCVDVYEKLKDIRNYMCCGLEEYLGNDNIGIYDNIGRLYASEVELYHQYKKSAEEHRLHLEIQRKSDISKISDLYDLTSCELYNMFSEMKKVAYNSTEEVVDALTLLLESMKKVDVLEKALEKAESLEETLCTDNRKLSDENNKLRERIDAMNSPESEMNRTLISNNNCIIDLTCHNNRLSATICELHKKYATLEDDVEQLQSEKVQLQRKYALLGDIVEKYRVSSNRGEFENVDYVQMTSILFEELSVFKSEAKKMEDEKADLKKYINQLEVENQNLHTSRSKNELQGELPKLAEAQEQLPDERIFLTSKDNEVLLDMKEQLKKCEAEKENWKTLFENLESRISPFKAQLDNYEDEKNLLLSQNTEKQHELESLRDRYAMILGNQNPKQKIKHVMKMKNENVNLRKEVKTCQEKILKLEADIHKLKFAEAPSAQKGPKHHSVLKENNSKTS